MIEMDVKLIRCTEDAERVCAMAARTCYSADTPSELFDKVTDKGIAKVLDDVIKSGHDSVLEHATFSFAVSGVSRVLTHQLVRHRLASYEQQSERYVELKDIKVVAPRSIAYNIEANIIFSDAVAKSIEAYNQLVKGGIDCEDARYVLPQGTVTQLVITMNARELRHFFSLRCCNRAQEEIRGLANLMRDICIEKYPLLFKDSGPACVRGSCPEGKRCCGHPWRNKDE